MAIKRYTRPEMEKIWSDERKFQSWLDVETAILEAKEELGLILAGSLLESEKMENLQSPRLKRRKKKLNMI